MFTSLTYWYTTLIRMWSLRNRSNTKDSVWPHYQTPRSSSKILRNASYCQLSPLYLKMWSNTVFRVWCITSPAALDSYYLKNFTRWSLTFNGLLVLPQSLSTAFIGEALLHSSFEKDVGNVAAGEPWSQTTIFALRRLKTCLLCVLNCQYLMIHRDLAGVIVLFLGKTLYCHSASLYPVV